MGVKENILKLARENPRYISLESGIKSVGELSVPVLGSAKSYLVAALARGLDVPILLITAKPLAAREMAGELEYWLGEGGVYLFPEPDTLPYQQTVSDKSNESERLKLLSVLLGAGKGGKHSLMVASSQAVMQKLPSKK